MPIYEYRCSSCGTEHEALQKISDAPLVTCPSCHADALTKLVSAAGFQLKGSGWYATDFRNGSKGSKPSDKPDAPAGDGKSGDGKSDTKSDGGSSDSKAAEPKSGAAPAACGTGSGCH